MELVYGCNPCGHNNMGIRAVLSQNSARDPTFVQPTLERGRVDSLKTEAVLETFQNVVQKTKFILTFQLMNSIPWSKFTTITFL